jgi:hypothetical protein
MNAETIAAAWAVVFTAMKWILIWLAATNTLGTLLKIHAVLTH